MSNYRLQDRISLNNSAYSFANVQKRIDRFLRRLVPATSRLSFNPFFKVFVDLVDLPARLIWPEFRRLPPNHMRIRVGAGNRFITNQLYYLMQAEYFWLFCIASRLVGVDSNILDIGSGCGRFAHHLRDFRLLRTRYGGRYFGVDIDPEMLQWCSKNFDSRFTFFHSPHSSQSYNQQGSAVQYVLPLERESIDFVFSTSLFTHLLEPELTNYCEESWRVLKPGGNMLMYCFCLDYPPPSYGGRHTFSHWIGNAKVESVKVPEAAVAYTEEFLVSLVKRCGFKSVKLIAMSDWEESQSAILAEK
jgi:SAM-dependent methyltransferase